MTREHKELLLRDLCARLPYGVKVQSTFYNCDGTIWKYENEILTAGLLAYPITRYKPYLFPLSSMTKEQKEELKYLCDWENDRWGGLVVIQESEFCMNTKIIDWLNENHFDYNRLIEKSLALDATGLNIY